MQELRLAAVSEDGSYAVLVAPGHGGRFSLPIDDRLRVVARGQFSRLAQYEIEVERPLRPKEIQDRIRAGETAEEIADAAGLPIERVRRFEGPVLAERAYRAQEAQGATIRQPGDSGPGRRLGDVVAERLAEFGTGPDEAEWDSRKLADGSWRVQLMFTSGGLPRLAEWSFDPRSRHISPADEMAARLCLSETDLPAERRHPLAGGTATVTPIASRFPAAPVPQTAPASHPHPAAQPAARSGASVPGAAPRAQPVPAAAPRAEPAPAARPQPAPAARPQPAHVPVTRRAPAAQESPADTPAPQPPQPERPVRKAAGGRSRRASVPSWDEIMFGTSRQPD